MEGVAAEVGNDALRTGERRRRQNEVAVK